MREAARPILLATAIFWAGGILGFVLTAWNPVLESFFVSPPMRSAIEQKRLWTESLTRTAPTAGGQIATNNINVSLLTWALGLTFGIGTVWLLFFNGIMLGAIPRRACAGHALAADGVHRRPRVPGTAGHLDQRRRRAADGPGDGLPRAIQPARRAAAEGPGTVQIIVGIVPILLVAGAIEAFVSPSDLPGAAKALLGLSLAIALLGYIVTRGNPAMASRPSETG